MALFTTYYFVTDSGRSPVKEFIQALDPRSQRKFFYVRALLDEFGPRLPMPHAKYIGDDIFELRFTGSEGNIRVLYFFVQSNNIIFLHGFIKKSKRIPRREKMVALERKQAFKKEGEQ